MSLLEKVNTPCADNGRTFTKTERLDNIKNILTDSDYFLLKDAGLSLIYGRKGHEKNTPCILISCHIDSLYSKYHFSKFNETEILGTFDNSICNAALIYLMIKGRLPANVIVAFTGDEENECRGAKETIEHIRDNFRVMWENLQLTVVLDITSEGYDDFSFTIENYFIKKGPREALLMRFSSGEDFRDYLGEKLSLYDNVKFIGEDADPDETWEYNKYDLNCFTFCFPAKPHPDNEKTDAGYWMHNDLGMLIKKENAVKYPEALAILLQGVANDLPAH